MENRDRKNYVEKGYCDNITSKILSKLDKFNGSLETLTNFVTNFQTIYQKEKAETDKRISKIEGSYTFGSVIMKMLAQLALTIVALGALIMIFMKPELRDSSIMWMFSAGSIAGLVGPEVLRKILFKNGSNKGK